MDVNKPEQSGGIPALLRAVAMLAVLVLAGIGILAVLGIIPQEALKEWATKGGLIAVILVAAGVVLSLLGRK